MQSDADATRNHVGVALHCPVSGPDAGHYPVDRFEFGSSHGWYIGREERWGLLPGDEAAWPGQWLHHCEAAGIGLGQLGFASAVDREEFVRDASL